MGAYDDIRAIAREGPLTAARQRRINHRRAQAGYAALTAAPLPASVDVRGYQITVHRVELHPQDIEPIGQRLPGLNIWCEVWRDGRRIDCDAVDTRDLLDHFHFPNPPLLVDDPAGVVDEGGRRFREDPGAVILQQIVDVARTVER